MRKSGDHGICIVDTVPSPSAFRLLSVKVFSAACRIKIMKFMGRAGADPLPENLPVLFLQSQVSESGKSGRLISLSRNDPCAFPVLSVHILEILVEIHKSPALRHHRKSLLQGLFYLSAHICIFFKFPAIKFRIAPVKKEAVQLLREPGIMDGRKFYK